MSYDVINLCKSILTENFGPVAALIGCTLLDSGPLTLPQICSFSKVRNPRKYLSVLVRHGIVSWDNSDFRGIKYTAHENTILCRLRVASLVRAVGKDRGQLSELICEEMLLHGAVTETGLIESVTQRAMANVEPGQNVTEASIINQVKSSFKQLSKDNFVRMMIPPEQELDNEDKEKHGMTNGGNSGTPNGKSGSIPSLWKVNLIRLQRCLLNHSVLEAVQRRFGGCPKMNEVLRTIIDLIEDSELKSGYADSDQGCDFQIVNAESVSINVTSINQSLKHFDKTVVNNLLGMLANDRENTGFIKRVGEAGGGQYVLDWYMALKKFTTSIVESVIRERFGGESVRIFNVLLAKGFSEQSDVEKLSLLTGKDVKQQLYTMLGDGFLTLAEIPRVGADYAPARTSYFYSVDLHRVANVVTGSCVQTMCNLMQRRNHEVEKQQNLLDKNDRLENLKDSMRSKGSSEEEIEEVADSWMGLKDREQLEQFAARLYKLDNAEAAVDHSLFLLRLFVRTHQKLPLFS